MGQFNAFILTSYVCQVTRKKLSVRETLVSKNYDDDSGWVSYYFVLVITIITFFCSELFEPAMRAH